MAKVDTDKIKDYLFEYLEKTHEKAAKNAYNCVVCGSCDNLSYNPRKNLWKCFSCERGGDIIDLYAHDHNLNPISDFRKIFDELCADIGCEYYYEDGTPCWEQAPPPLTPPEPPAPASDIPQQLAKWRETLFSSSGIIGRSYLESRCISRECAERLGLGFAPDYNKNNYRRGWPYVILPGMDGASYRARRVPRAGEIINEKYRYMCPAGVKIKIFDATIDRTHLPTLWICEGDFDAASIWCAGGAAISIGSVSNLELLRQYWAGRENRGFSQYVLAFDSDEPGQKATEEALQMANVFRIRSQVGTFDRTPGTDGEHWDVNEYWCNAPKRMAGIVSYCNRQGLGGDPT